MDATKMNAALTAEIVRAVQARLGQRDPEVGALIAHEVALALDAGPAADRGQGPAGTMDVALDRTAAHCVTVCGPGSAAAQGVLTERVVVTANGRNRRGIVAGLTEVIRDVDGDIRDISQTIVGDYFTMIIVVDIAATTRQGTRFGQFKERLEQAGGALGVHVVALHDDILTTMHTV